MGNVGKGAFQLGNAVRSERHDGKRGREESITCRDVRRVKMDMMDVGEQRKNWGNELKGEQ